MEEYYGATGAKSSVVAVGLLMEARDRRTVLREAAFNLLLMGRLVSATGIRRKVK